MWNLTLFHFLLAFGKFLLQNMKFDTCVALRRSFAIKNAASCLNISGDNPPLISHPSPQVMPSSNLWLNVCVATGRIGFITCWGRYNEQIQQFDECFDWKMVAVIYDIYPAL